MKKFNTNRIIISILAVMGLIVGTICKKIHDGYSAFMRWFAPRKQRDVLAFLIGILATIIFIRYVSPEVRVKTVEVPIEVEVTPVPTEVPFNEEAANMARVLYGLTQYNLSDNAKIAIFETIDSRAKCTYGEFGDTINEVCLKPNQWQGFVENSDYLLEDYELAINYLNDSTGARLTPDGCYWLTVSNNGVTVRDRFEGGHAWSVS